jgi:hypothetical protein
MEQRAKHISSSLTPSGALKALRRNG